MTLTRTLLSASLILTIACDDADRVDIDETQANSARQGLDATPERALRAVQIIKATRAASEVVRHNPLAPAETTLNCDSVVSVDVESLDSSCEVMPDEGYIVTLEGCEMDNGETFDAELVVSTPDIESGDIAAANSVVDPTRVLAVAPMWMANHHGYGNKNHDLWHTGPQCIPES